MSKRKLVLASAAALFGTCAFAAGFGFYEMDAHSTALGGHVYGRPKNASAVYYNPGGMQSLTGTVVTLGFTLVNPRADARIDKRHDTRMNGGWLGVPTFFVTQELPWDLHFGFGGFADFGIASAYNNHWELKHDSTETSFEGYTLQPVISYDITKDWSFGIGPRFTFVDFETRMMRDFSFVESMYRMQSRGYLHSPAKGKNRLKVKADNRDDIGVGLAAGTSYRVTDDFSLGVMYRSRVKTRLKGDASWKGQDIDYHRNDVHETIQLPAQISVGFNWDNALWLDGFHLASSVSWIEWSKMSALRFDIWNPITKNVDRDELKLDWRNTYRAGFGLGYDLTENWEILAGYIYDWDPCRNRVGYAHTMLPIGDRHIASTGVAWTSDDGKWEVALTYALIIMESKSQRIRDEYYAYNHEVHKMHTHNSYSHLVSLGVTYRF